MSDVVLAADIGGTKTAVALTGPGARIVASASAPTPGGDGPQAIVAVLADLAARLLRQADVTRVIGVGIGTAGAVDTASEIITSSTETLAGWAGTPVSALVREALGECLSPEAPVLVQNDVDAHAWGEFRFGAATGATRALVVAVGTGIGAGMIADGHALRGMRNPAGDIAHLPAHGAEGLPCTCGAKGHLEAIGSGLGIRKRYVALGGDPAVRDSRAIAERARAGDAAAERAIADSAAAVAGAITDAVSLVHPDVIVVTGGVPDIGEAWWGPLRHAVEGTSAASLPIVPGRLGSAAPLRGAADPVWAQLLPSHERDPAARPRQQESRREVGAQW